MKQNKKSKLNNKRTQYKNYERKNNLPGCL